jgi:hypothetical protein
MRRWSASLMRGALAGRRGRGVDRSLEATPASWRRYPNWSRPLGVAALAGALIALPLCAGIALAVASDYSDSFRALEVTFGGTAADSGRTASVFAGGVVLAVVALIAALAAVWLNPTPARAPRAARWALIISLLDLAFLAAAMIGAWAYIVFSGSGPA